MVLSFKDYQSINNLDFNNLGQINEMHQYSNEVCSVMDKITFYVKRNFHLENSSLNESAKEHTTKISDLIKKKELHHLVYSMKC